MKLSVIVPVYNEERTIASLLDRLMQVRHPDWQIIVVDDGSTDRSQEILLDKSKQMAFELILKCQNEGKTSAILCGLEVSHGDWILVQDADLEYEPEDVHRLISVLDSSQSVVYGRRSSYWCKPSRWLFAAGVLGIDLALWTVYGRFVRDHATCYKLLPKSLVKSLDLRSLGFEGCVEITAKIMRLQIDIRQISIHYYPRSPKEGKKLTAMHGLKALCAVWRWRNWEPQVSSTIRNESKSKVVTSIDSQRTI